MPSHPCRWPTCPAYVPDRGGYCPEHATQGRQERTARSRYYDAHVRDRSAKAFYNSAAWQRARRGKLAAEPWCERCREQGRAGVAEHVHHRRRLRDCTPAERLDRRNLMAVCVPCHNAVEAELGRERQGQ